MRIDPKTNSSVGDESQTIHFKAVEGKRQFDFFLFTCEEQFKNV